MNPFDGGGADSPNNVPGISPLARVPVAPREPTPRARPLVFGFGPGGRILLIVGIGFLLMGSLFTRIFCRDLPADVALSFAGQKAEGTVRSVETDSHMKVNGRSPKVVTFDYVADGQTHHSTSAVLDGTSPKTGAPVSVEYLSWSADCARIVGTTRN
jgi:hypothetical protein